MALKRLIVNQSYGLGDALLTMAPLPIIARRDPTTADLAELGTVWCNVVTSTIYMLASITAGSANWTTSPASGVGVFTSVTINPGNLTITAGNAVISAGDLTVTAGNTVLGGDLTVAGTTTLNGDIDITSAALIDLTSTLDAAPSILLHANGGTAESIELHSDQGTSDTSIYIHSDVGSVTVESSRNAANAIIIAAQAGGIDITAVGAAAGEDIDISAVGSSVNISSTEVAGDAIVINATNGGVDIAGNLDVGITAVNASINLTASEAAADAIVIHASNAAGGVQIRAGSGGIQIGNEADTTPISVGSTAPTVDRTITLGAGTIVTDGVDDVINLGTGGMTADGDEQITRTINIGTGTTTAINNAAATADLTVNIASGNVTDDGSGTAILTVNIATGTNTSATQTVNMGSAGATVLIDGTVTINESINLNTAINSGTSTGTVDIGNAAAGDITLTTAGDIILETPATVGVTLQNSVRLITGAGSPDTVITAPAGSLFLRTDPAGATSRLYINTDSATAWTNITCAA